jgi:hypothetical protein
MVKHFIVLKTGAFLNVDNVWKLQRYILFVTSDSYNDDVTKERSLSINMYFEQFTKVCWLFEKAE